MSTNTGIKWLGLVLGLCVIAIALESYYLWNLRHKVETQNNPTFSAAWPKNWNPWSDNWDPTGQIAQLQQQMNNLMNQMSPGHSIFSQQGFGLSPSSPQITMHDGSKQYKVVVQVPKGEDVEINTNLSDNRLTIHGKVRQSTKQQSGNALGQELAVSQFSQTMTLPDPVDESKMKVKQDDNQIVITVPKVG